MRFTLALFCLFGLSFVHSAELYTDPATGLSVLRAEIELPSKGFWYLHPDHLPREHLGFLFLLDPK
ncbi:MAG: hypothetical protein JJU05_16905 [Verrucomicrobia bacterium]|nr:hypothetical protein [Verrucomicrobiota bacterium]MCH8528805.1 hypothetical protein [Kiritimatiellia bacterium]